MKTFELWFYRQMLWFMKYDLAIARSTGRDPKDIAQIIGDIQNMEGSLLRLEINHG
jgi:hypothetical protein